MVVKNDIKDQNGRLILSRGIQIDEKHIRIFKIWGIMEVDILMQNEQEELEQIEGLSSEQKQKAGELIRDRYLKSNNDNPCIQEIYKHDLLLTARNINAAKDQSTQETPRLSAKKIQLLQQNPLTPEYVLSDELHLLILPEVFYKLNEIINNPLSSAKDISRVVETDTALTAKMLKLVNSPFYGFQQKIDTISKAVTIIGTKQLSMLALGLSLAKIFRDIPSSLLNMKSFWKHSLAVGLCARNLAAHINISNTEKIFVAGILHDLGRLILLSQVPDRIAASILYAWGKNIFLLQAEEELIGFTHTLMGQLLCNKWKLPIMFEDITAHHHQPENSSFPNECALVHVAEVIINALRIGSSGEKMVLKLNDWAWESLGISAAIINPSLKQIDTELDYLCGFFEDEEQ